MRMILRSSHTVSFASLISAGCGQISVQVRGDIQRDGLTAVLGAKDYVKNDLG